MSFAAIFCLVISSLIMMACGGLVVMAAKEDEKLILLCVAVTFVCGLLSFGALCGGCETNGNASKFIEAKNITRSPSTMYVEYELEGKLKNLQSKDVLLYNADDSNIVINVSWGLNSYRKPISVVEKIVLK